ncbi:ribosomal large subunit pseudouridine synthase B [Clostridium pasteurianum DSM 525 = ATCC 6013]|uniref:Pseudouridine synthase n=1 Tax=Clostridium pasteurianum DSM 525 = ATCC 6013 TaxID=1262449 RepID=A0A0H3J7Y3_CLOPA|nr:pseudouridine synthase [Clostridium pasteurianum]AJA48013.1 ribosomal large subunit pseudouridine synthase B [Clostridium pasteurianum DSM 525 = ATCC 6013]AJA52001.1 ribosomal large subunit pseudouridine synthase B [Clostridium pasteurianum DSM 525 = ATCC 6013]AOZ75296.1 pseudouridine synthase [Clostridium pasteurianum DSM 525 = ATCC 6013]AOZ79091.1 pseudouridine synthase [Clostridium pasteurianum]ELP59916.1 ribosomal large subunit pseudouridine synthase B [Clostridium pasteurianum DSM 525 
MKERLQKFMASCGVASRRNCEKMIEEGKVKVNGIVVRELGVKVETDSDEVLVNNEKIFVEKKQIYIMLNKPEGYLCTLKDERGRKTVLDIVKVQERIFPIGRLDYDTSGLLLMTNDGDIYNKVIHPRKKVDKIYEATIKGYPSKEQIEKFCKGIDIGNYITAPANFMIIDGSERESKVKITIHEGKKRQIRKMCKCINHPVITLNRLSIGDIKLDSHLKKGQWRFLKDSEIDYLKNL